MESVKQPPCGRPRRREEVRQDHAGSVAGRTPLTASRAGGMNASPWLVHQTSTQSRVSGRAFTVKVECNNEG